MRVLAHAQLTQTIAQKGASDAAAALASNLERSAAWSTGVAAAPATGRCSGGSAPAGAVAGTAWPQRQPAATAQAEDTPQEVEAGIHALQRLMDGLPPELRSLDMAQLLQGARAAAAAPAAGGAWGQGALAAAGAAHGGLPPAVVRGLDRTDSNAIDAAFSPEQWLIDALRKQQYEPSRGGAAAATDADLSSRQMLAAIAAAASPSRPGAAGGAGVEQAEAPAGEGPRGGGSTSTSDGQVGVLHCLGEAARRAGPQAASSAVACGCTTEMPLPPAEHRLHIAGDRVSTLRSQTLCLFLQEPAQAADISGRGDNYTGLKGGPPTKRARAAPEERDGEGSAGRGGHGHGRADLSSLLHLAAVAELAEAPHEDAGGGGGEDDGAATAAAVAAAVAAAAAAAAAAHAGGSAHTLAPPHPGQVPEQPLPMSRGSSFSAASSLPAGAAALPEGTPCVGGGWEPAGSQRRGREEGASLKREQSVPSQLAEETTWASTGAHALSWAAGQALPWQSPAPKPKKQSWVSWLG